MYIGLSYGEWVGLGSAFIWALHSLLLRTQVHKAAPTLLNAYRCGVASLFFWLLLPFGPPLSAYGEVTAWEWFMLAGSVLLAIGVGDTLHMIALRELGVARAMGLSGIHPLTTLLFERLLLGTVFSEFFVLGCGLVAAGVFFLSQRGRAGETQGRVHYGIAMVLLATVLWGLATVMTKPALTHLTAVQANCVRMPLVALVLFVPWRRGKGAKGLGLLDKRTLVIMAGVGLLGMGLGSMSFLMALDLIGPTKTTVLASFSPVIALVLAAVFLREKVTVRIVLGMILCTAGVLLVL